MQCRGGETAFSPYLPGLDISDLQKSIAELKARKSEIIGK